MAKQPAKSKTADQILIEQLMLNIGTISGVIEERGKNIFVQGNILSKDEINDYSVEFLELFVMLLQSGSKVDRRSAEFKALRQLFTTMSQQIQVRGGNMEEFVRYIQFMQHVMIDGLGEDGQLSAQQLKETLLLLAGVFNDIILDVYRVYLEQKESTIQAQQEELREISTPITEIWDGVLTLPIIGTLDSSRTMIVMEKLLERIEQDRARVVVMDVTGVLAIDSQVSHHLVQMIRAVGLMGASAVLTGIRPEIARALTSLNIELGDVLTRSTLAEGLKEAFKILDVHVVTSQ
ncbi:MULTISPECIES: STAS domain-containing protein [unclassified Thioalkalivibrio]|uniref:STAS domain-containing protein n=1 Tax=unclassified Thioalkalivibrio TaxID=2621013 RepID=UPI0003823B5E|nr:MULTISPECIES: STAS domain-containing protein [unclassified Thioalkalivibrio]